jgi:hypothetical protein
MRDLIEAANPSWTGVEHCWYNPTTRDYIPVAVGDDDHSGSSHLLAPISTEEFEERFPGVDASDFEYEPISSDEITELLPVDNYREAGIMLGYAQVNCNPRITTIPYVIARTKEDLVQVMRYLNRRGVYPEEHPRFRAETVNCVNGEMVYGSFIWDSGRLIPG